MTSEMARREAAARARRRRRGDGGIKVNSDNAAGTRVINQYKAHKNVDKAAL
jgi:hypothetical protein